MVFIQSLINWLVRKRSEQIEYFMTHPGEVQNNEFQKLISVAANTEWGKKYDYDSIKSHETFKGRVPVSTYEELLPFIERVRGGEQNVLWPEEIKWFAKSSGTTNGKSKFIPISKSTLESCHFRGGKDVLTLYAMNYPDTRMFLGKGLVMGGSRSLKESNNNSYFEGDLSAILIGNMPHWAKRMRAPSESIALMEEWESKLFKMAKYSIDQNITSISGVPSWTLVLLNKVLQMTGKNNIMEVWPQLEAFFHGGVSFEPYRQQYASLLPADKMRYMETYNASEGFFGIQDRPGERDMLLMLDYGIFYEFIPLDDVGKNYPKALTLEEVEPFTHYAMVISTNSGLWRYMIGDTVQFTSINPYRIQISGRTQNFINVVGEELMVDNAEKALAKACEQTRATIRDYTAAPLYSDNHICHEWLIEFIEQPDDFAKFQQLFDESLKSLNSDYEAKRYHDLVLKPPILKSLEKGSFYHWLKKRDKLGGQNKVPRLLNNRKMLDDILENSKLATDNFNI
ncbi:MAG: GH3 auxin-responsive promoter family protein [Bacteroidales bacterium]|nr:GH3 auxin-responsive promoter family protein [Bacteroidales bacterium]